MRRTNRGQQQLSFEPNAEHTIAGASLQPLTTSTAPPITILRLPEVCRITGLCRSLVYELEANGAFPRRVPLGARSVGWVDAEVQRWLAERVSARAPGITSLGGRTADARTIRPQVRQAQRRTASARTLS